MVKPFLVVDVTNENPDFHLTSLEAGVPLLDKSGVGWQILRKWIGIHVAEPEWFDQQRIGFFIRNEQSRRPENPNCQTITPAELEGPFRKSLEQLLNRLQTAAASGSREELVQRVAQQELQSLVSDPSRRRERCCYFVKYRDDNGKWQLVWCPGYRQKPSKPGTPVICTNPDCSLLFLRRLDANPKCPTCHSVRVSQRSSILPKLIAAAVLLVVIVAGTSLFNHGTDDELDPPPAPPPELVVTPDVWSGPVGSKIQFSVILRTGQDERNVSREVVVEVLDPKIVDVKQYWLAALARSPGKTAMRFNLGRHLTQATLTVEPPVAPANISIEPNRLDLAVGASKRLKVIGSYQDGRTADLTDAAVWSTDRGAPLFVYHGLVEGLPLMGNAMSMPGNVIARYRPTPDSEYLEDQIPVTVTAATFDTLKLTLDPTVIRVGQAAMINAVTVTQGGDQSDVAESSALGLSLEPDGIGVIDGRYVRGLSPGTTTVLARFEDLESSVDLTVSDVDSRETAELRIAPTAVDLVVGEAAELRVVGPDLNRVTMESLNPSVVSVQKPSRLIGLSPGTGKVIVSHDEQKVDVEVTVVESQLRSIVFIPDEATVAVDMSLPLRIVGYTEEAGSQQIEVSPGRLDWLRLPDPAHVNLSMQPLKVRGVLPTRREGERLTVRYQGLTASVRIRVVTAPLRLVMTPSGQVKLPVGRKLRLSVNASYGSAQTVRLDPDRVEWVLDPAEGVRGVELRGGVVHAVRESDVPLKVKAVYQSHETEWLEVSTASPTPLELSLQFDRDLTLINVGETGQVKLKVREADGQSLVELSGDFLRFSSSSPEILAVDSRTGAYRALSPGNAVIEANYTTPHAEQTSSRARLSVSVQPVPDQPKPTSIALTSGWPSPVKLRLNALFDDYRVMARFGDGEELDITRHAILTVIHEGDGLPPLSTIRRRLRAVRVGEATVRAEFAGLVSNAMRVRVLEESEIDEIRVRPLSAALSVGESVSVEAVGFMSGQPVGDLTQDAGLEWRVLGSEEELNAEVVTAEGATITGHHVGEAEVVARLDNITSKPVKVRVREAPREPLRVTPSNLALQTGESILLGDEIRVHRGEVDVTDRCQVTPASVDVVRYEQINGSLVGGVPGITQVTFTLATQSVSADVEVTPAELPSRATSIVIEPQTAMLSVGEQLQPRVYLDLPSGRRVDRTSSALFESSQSDVVKADTGGLLGLSPGSADVTARLPGVDQPAELAVSVDGTEFSSIEVSPRKLKLAIGDVAHFKIVGVADTGRRTLGEHPDLEVSIAGEDSGVVKLSGARHLSALNGGVATVLTKWRDLQPVELGVTVSGDALGELVMEPQDARIEVGEEINMRVLGRRGEHVQALTVEDGVELRIDNPARAEAGVDGRIRGVSAGETAVVATLGQLSAISKLTVAARNTPDAPRGAPIQIRFIPDILRAELGTPGSSFRLVRFRPGGDQEDVAHLATFKFLGPQNVVRLEGAPSGQVLRPLQIGQTSVEATLDGLTTESPLMIEVAESLRSQARVVIRPNPLVLNPGEAGRFSTVVLIPRTGGQPIELPYRLEATKPNAVEVLPDNSMRAVRGGRDLVNAVIQQPPDGKYHEIEGSATVEVRSQSRPNQTAETDLVLTGPTELTVGEIGEYVVELVNGNSRRSVTMGGAELVLVAEPISNSNAPAEVGPACRVTARRPGRIEVQARYQGHLSNIHRVLIKPIADEFERLEINIAPGPVAVGETREYKIYANPKGGEPRQEVTSRFLEPNPDGNGPHIIFRVLEPGPDVAVAKHRPPRIIGSSMGTISIQAAVGSTLRSEPVQVRITKGPEQNQLAELRIEPSEVSVAVGQETPQFQVMSRMRGESEFRQVDVRLEVMQPALVEPVPGRLGSFRAVATSGETTVKAVYQGQSASAQIRVRTSAISSVAPVAGIQLERVIRKHEFDLRIQIRGGTADQRLNYRCRLPERTSVTGWVDSETRDNQQSATLKTPPIPLGPPGTVYRLVIESRPNDALDETATERYPFSFTLSDEIPINQGRGR